MSVAAPRTPPERRRFPALRLRSGAPATEGGLARRARRSWPLMVAGCVVLAIASLTLPSQPTYDPMSWIIWGREIAGGTLHTVQGPSWKPLPVLFTTPFSVFGGDAAPQLWLVVARAGGLLGIAMGFRLAARLAGWPAGVIAAVAILASEGYVFNAWRGNSEGLLVGLTLWAVECHLDGRRTWAFALGFGAALLRPEVWPFWGLYGLLLAWREPHRRVLVGALFAAIPVAWFLPAYLGSGDFLPEARGPGDVGRAPARARQPRLDSAAYADFPALEVLRRASLMVPLVVAAGAVAALVATVRRRAGDHDRIVLLLGAAAGALLLAVAAMTQGGFSGNLRYVVLPVAFICVLAAAGWVEMVRATRRRLGAAAAVVLALLGLAAAAQAAREKRPGWELQKASAQREALGIDDLPRLIDRAGGARRVNRCGAVFTTPFQVPVVAWVLHRRLDDVDIFPLAPGVTIAQRGTPLARDPRFPTYAGTTRWVAGRSCRPS
jgi:hypothetical protein